MKLAYTAVDKRGTTNKATIEAPTIAEATESLRQNGLYVTDIKEAGTREEATRTKSSSRMGGGKTLKNLAIWSRQLCVLLRAGTPLSPALGAVEKQVPEGPWRSVLEEVRLGVESGMPLSEALGQHPDVFDEVSRSLVKAGESAGILGEMLDRTAMLIRQQLRVRQSISGALVYPLLLIMVGIVVTLVMVVGVLPRFAELFETMNAPLPPTTKILIGASGVIMTYWWAILIGLVGIGVGAKLFVSGLAGRRRLHTGLVNLPVIGTVVRSLATAKIARLMGVMLESKVSLLDALGLVKNSTGNVLYTELLDEAFEATSRGESISAVFSRSTLITPAVTEALRHGEQNAQIGPIMSDMADFLDEENEVVVKAAMSVLEPLILIVLGLVVGFIALSMFIPLFDLTSLAGGG